MSFKDSLKEKIERENFVTYESLVSFSQVEGFKISNMERRMRELCNEFPIKPVFKKSKRNTDYIAAWEWKNKMPTFKEIWQEETKKDIEKTLGNFPYPFPPKPIDPNQRLFN